MKNKIQTIEDIAKRGYAVEFAERNAIEHIAVALSSTNHLGAKKESLLELGWKQANYIGDAETLDESKELWDKVISELPLAIIVMTTTGANVIHGFIPNFHIFDHWCRLNETKAEEYWILPLGTTNEKVVSNQAFDNMSVADSTRHKANFNLKGLFQKKQKTLETFAAMCFEGITPVEIMQNAKGFSLMHTGSNDSAKESGVVRNFSSLKDVESIKHSLQEKKCTTMLVYLHKVYVNKPVVSKKEDVVES